MNTLTDADRAFLLEPWLGFLTVQPPDAWPTTTPVWFECTEEGTVQFFTAPATKKAKWLGSQPYASLVAANQVGEPEHWVSVSGPVRLSTDGVTDLVERLANRYWDLSDEAVRTVVDGWKDEDLVRVTIDPDRVVRYVG